MAVALGTLQQVREKVEAGERLDAEDGLALMESDDLLALGELADVARRTRGGDEDLGAYGLALGIAFQIADDILDCAGQTQETGKIPGTDLREGTPTMPLLYAAQQDEVVRDALAGGSLDGALLRVAATGAIERSREAALDYAARARAHLGAHPHREELEALTYAVVDRAG